MSVSAAHFKEVTNGYEKRSDGLWLHKGKADIGSARITGNQPPTNGAGLELLFVPTAPAASYIQSYDRDAAAWRDLNLRGLNVILAPQGGTVTMPNGSIGTAALATGAVQALIGSYVATPTWSTTTTNSWVATPVAILATTTTSGSLVRFEFSMSLSHSVPNAGWMVGLGWDGVAQASLAHAVQATGGGVVTTAGTYYNSTLGASSHTYQLFVYNFYAGTLSMDAWVNQALYVTEQRR